jgi:adenine-specific DNA-methyltransferase
MLKVENLNSKALQQLVFYFLEERIAGRNLGIRYLVATNIYEWFIFDAKIFEAQFAKNKALIKQYIEFKAGKYISDKTDFFYKDIAKPAIAEVINEIKFTHFDIRDYKEALENGKQNDRDLIDLFKVFSPPHLLKLDFANDSNSLNKPFYNELLYIIGLKETKEKGKKLIGRKIEGDRDAGSLLENAISRLIGLDKIPQLRNLANPEEFGETDEEKLFNVGLRLSINWINRVLFLKLLEAQLIKYHQGDRNFAFLNLDKVRDYQALDSLFFDVLAREQSGRDEDVREIFANVPYLNSSLFEQTEIEQNTITIGTLKGKSLPIFGASVLKDHDGKRRSGDLDALTYLFEFLDAYDFSSDELADGQEDSEKLINAAVLGLIFEKINGYKDGSFFTPSFITMYMCRETIRRAIVQKFNEVKGWNCENFDQLDDKISDKKEANAIINSLKICDPAVGSGHFLVSALNEIIAIKSELRVLIDHQGKSLKDYRVEVRNDKLMVYDDEGKTFAYRPNNNEKQRVQEALFHEKQTIIENCLFGVDINPNSVTICRLRLWIELLKNAYYKSNNQLETLPNIDINIKVGNSLISRFALDSDVSQVLKRQNFTIEQYRNAVQTYRSAESKAQKREMEGLIAKIKASFKITLQGIDPKKTKVRRLEGGIENLQNQKWIIEPTKEEKKVQERKIAKLKIEIDKLTIEIKDIEGSKIYKNALEWRFEFPEVLNDQGDFVGFDALIGNPPYMIVFDENTKHYYEQNFFEFRRNNDLYVAFIKMAYSLIKNGYIFSFITPNTFIKGSYFQAVRQFLSENYQLVEIIDFGNRLIFEDASVFCSITLGIKTKPKRNWVIKSDIYKIKGVIESRKSDFIIKNSVVSRLDELPKFEKFFYIKDVGFNYWSEGRGKVRGESIGSKVLYKGIKDNDSDIPYTKGSDINKYAISFSDNYLRNDYKKYLNENDTFRFSIDFLSKKVKIIYRQTSNKLIGALDVHSLYTDKTIHLIVNREEFNFDLKYVLALFNSRLLNYFFQQFKEEDGRAFAQVKTVDIKNLPFKAIEKDRQVFFIELVDQIITAKKSDLKADTSALETEIDQLVYQLYELTEAEIKIVEGVNDGK